MPEYGKLTDERAFIRFAGSYSDPRYSDKRYTYDTWGNQNSITLYTSEGTSSTLASSGGRTVTSCFGQSSPDAGGNCVADEYHTYLGWQKNPLNHLTSYTYNYKFGSPTRQTDPNNAVTDVDYDASARVIKIAQPGDTLSSPTIQATYGQSSTMYWVILDQKTGGTSPNTLSQFFNGLGQLIQTQTFLEKPNAWDPDKNVIIDYGYDAYGNQAWTSAPYSVSTGSGYRTPQTAARTSVIYDFLGRMVSSRAVQTSGAYEVTASYEYSDSSTTAYDARGNPTKTVNDSFGRVDHIITGSDTEPVVPTVYYTYDALDRLIGVEKGSAPETQITYDYAGNKTAMTDPDMGAWSYQYNALGELVKSTDAKLQTTSLTYDAAGRMTQKSPTSPSYTDLFNLKDTSNWTWGTTCQTVPFNDGENNVVALTGNGTNWDCRFTRSAYTLTNGDTVQLRFKVSQSNAKANYYIESSDATHYFAVIADTTNLILQRKDGSTYTTLATLLSTLQTNTWYNLQIVLDDSSGFVAKVYKENDPSVSASFIYTGMPAGLSYKFIHSLKSYTSYVDDYREFTTPTIYTYDQGTNGFGRRTSMSDVSGSTSWVYDTRGRVTQETRIISGTGGGTFVTQYGYNPADALTYIKYPKDTNGTVGEQVNYAYYRQLALNTVIGNRTYVQHSTYDAAGRVTNRDLDTADYATNFSYFGWTTINQWGRLQRIWAGDIDLNYTYDNNGNILTIVDSKAGPQTQSFTYDDANRLASAVATGGANGTYNSRQYEYDADGRLISKDGQSIAYSGSYEPFHAATLMGSNTYTYDANGNMAFRDLGATEYALTYDEDNQLVGMDGDTVAKYVYDGDGKRVKAVESDGVTVYVGNALEVFTPATAVPTPQPTPTPTALSFAGQVKNQASVAVPGVGVNLRRKEVCTVAPGTGTLSASVSAAKFQTLVSATLYIYKYDSTFVRSVYVFNDNGSTTLNFDPQSLDGGSYQAYVRVELTGGIYRYSTISAFAINHGQTTTKSFTATATTAPTVTSVTPLPWTGQTATTNTTIASTTSYTDGNYRLNYASPSCPSSCNCTLHIDNLGGYPAVSASTVSPGTVINASEIKYAWTTSGNYGSNNFTIEKLTTQTYGTVWRTYYAAGGNPLAMRVEGSTTAAENGVYYFLGDQLNSTSVTMKLSMAGTLTKLAELRYMPWGENRASGYAETATPTDIRYTGQRKDNGGLYFYNARWFDPSLGRMAQADSMIPDPYNPLDWDRFSYVRNNPLRYTDPSGRTIWDVVDFIFFAISSAEFNANPSWVNAGWAALDAVSLLPVIPSVGYFRYGDEAVALANKIYHFVRRFGAEMLLKVLNRGEGGIDLVRQFFKISHIPGSEKIIRNLANGAWQIVKGARFELNYAARFADDIAEIGRRLAGGRED